MDKNKLLSRVSLVSLFIPKHDPRLGWRVIPQAKRYRFHTAWAQASRVYRLVQLDMSTSAGQVLMSRVLLDVSLDDRRMTTAVQIQYAFFGGGGGRWAEPLRSTAALNPSGEPRSGKERCGQYVHVCAFLCIASPKSLSW